MELEEIERHLKEWEENVLKPSLQKMPERKEEFLTRESWVPIKRVYTPLDVKDIDYIRDIGMPGEYPFTRGVQATMYRSKFWTMRAQTGFGPGEDTNARIKYLLKQGMTGLSIDLDVPGCICVDSDEPRAAGEVGRLGVSIDSVVDMEALYDGILLDQVTTSFSNANHGAAVIYAMYLAEAEKQGVPWEKVGGTTQNEPLSAYCGHRYNVLNPKGAVRLFTDLVTFAAKHTPRWNTTSIWLEGGSGSPVLNSGIGLAAAMAYADALIEAGMDVDEFAPRLSFLTGVRTDFFEEIARLRAIRRLWARIMKEKYGAKKPESMRFRFYGPSVGIDTYAKEPLNNIVRGTIATMASALGGANAIDLAAYDEPFAIPTEASKLMCLRTQQIIAYESGIGDVVDPLGGSYYVEALTSEIEEELKRIMKRIEDQGGAVAAIEKGYTQKLIADANYRREKEKYTGARPVIGVNMFVTEEKERPIEIMKLDPKVEQRQIERTKRVKAERDNVKAQALLQRIREAASGTENLMPIILEAVKAHVTQGEIIGAVEDVFGEWQEVKAF
jgi:methylmalonyl-CoA mutase N-terminal domain/subunit